MLVLLGDEAECGGTASYRTGADVHQCFEYATQAGFNVSEVAGLGLASANVCVRVGAGGRAERVERQRTRFADAAKEGPSPTRTRASR